MITADLDVMASNISPMKNFLDIYLPNYDMSENESECDEMKSNSSCSSSSSFNDCSRQIDLLGSLSSTSSDCLDADQNDLSFTDDDCFLHDFNNSLFYGTSFSTFEPSDVTFGLEATTSASLQRGISSLLLKDLNENSVKSQNDILKAMLEETSSLLKNQGINFFQSGKPMKTDFSSNFDINMENASSMENNSTKAVSEITFVERDDVEPHDKESKSKSHNGNPKIKRKKRKYERRASARKNIQLYQFMLRLLDQKDDCVAWVSREEGIFRLLKSKVVADMWGRYKKNENMTYESLSRALRHYYSQDILVPVPKKLHYKFCKKTLEEWYKAAKSM